MAVTVAALAIALGNWQRHRADEKRAAAAAASAAASQPPLDLAQASAALTSPNADIASVLYRTVRASGEFDATHAVLIDNKVHQGRPGYEVVTPLKLAPGDRYVLVDRGWVAQGPTRQQLPLVVTPAGPVQITGRANVPSARYIELTPDTQTGAVRQNLDIGRIAAASGLGLLPIVVEQSDPVFPPDDLVREWPRPDFGIERHLSYMLQWYSLAGLALVLWLGLNWKPRMEAEDRGR